MSNNVTASIKFPKSTQPTPKKPKRPNSIKQIIIKIDEPAKTVFEKIPNLKINFIQLKYIIENTLVVQDPSSVLRDLYIS
jgi:hypothetical protein